MRGQGTLAQPKSGVSRNKGGRPSRLVEALIETRSTEIVLARDRQSLIQADVAKLAQIRAARQQLLQMEAEIQLDLCHLCAKDEGRIRVLREQNAETCGCVAA
jgi:hypothetical protein